MFKFYILFIFLLNVFYVSAQLSNFNNCQQRVYPINLTQLIFEPNPIEIGKNLTTTISGTNTLTIQPGAILSATFNYNGKLVANNEFDLCNELGKCPIEPGYFDIAIKSIPSLSANYPMNTSYSFDTIFSGNKF